MLFRDTTEQVKIKQELQQARDDLELRVKERTAELALTNAQLQTEVAERKKIEENLHQAYTYNRRLIEASLDPLVTISRAGIIGDVNAATELATGCPRQDLIGTEFASYFTDPAKAREGINTVFETGSVLDFELGIRHKQGTILPVLFNASIYADETGLTVGAFAAARNISRRKAAEEKVRLQTAALEADRKRLIELSQAERDQRIFAESLMEATQVLNSSLNLNEVFDDISRQILHVIDLCAVNIGLLADEKVRVVHHFGFDHYPEAIKAIQNEFSLAEFPMLQQVIASRLPLIMPDIRKEPTWIVLPGMEWIVSYVLAPLLAGDRVIGFLNIFGDQVASFSPETSKRLNVFANQSSLAIQNARLYEDLAKSLEAEKTIRQKLIEEEKFSAMGRMLASVSHEINNPLQTIKNSLFLIKRATGPDSPTQEYLEMAVSETSRIANLVAQLRELYRPKLAGQFGLYRLAQLLDDVHLLIAPHLASQSVRWEQAPGHEDLQVNCVGAQIKQVFINLCMNAAEAMQPDGGILTTSIVLSEDTLQAGVRFKDTGPGIPPEILSNIFEPFFTTKAKGLGLGLSICYELVQSHKGHITVESQVNQGATFTIWLPAVQTTMTVS